MKNILVLICVFFSACTLGDRQENVQVKQQSLPVLTEKKISIDSAKLNAVEITQAYQRQVTNNKNIKIAVYKAGLTQPGAPQKFGLTKFIVGAIPATSVIQGNVWGVSKSSGTFLMQEIELGFQFSEDITNLPDSVSALKSKLKAIYPVLEIPNLAYNPQWQINGKNLIESNIAAHKVFIDAKPITENALHQSLAVHLNDEKIFEKAVVNDILGVGQWQVLYWIVEELLLRGYRINKDQIIISGAIGKMFAAKPGVYIAQFGTEAKIKWSVK